MYIFQDLGNSLTIDKLVNVVTLLVNRDVNGIGITEEVVHVAENLLISANQEDTYIIRFVLHEGMNREVVRQAVSCYVSRHLSVRIAGDVLECGYPVRILVETVDRHHGEHLVNSPSVGE